MWCLHARQEAIRVTFILIVPMMNTKYTYKYLKQTQTQTHPAPRIKWRREDGGAIRQEEGENFFQEECEKFFFKRRVRRFFFFA